MFILNADKNRLFSSGSIREIEAISDCSGGYSVIAKFNGPALENADIDWSRLSSDKHRYSEMRYAERAVRELALRMADGCCSVACMPTADEVAELIASEEEVGEGVDMKLCVIDSEGDDLLKEYNYYLRCAADVKKLVNLDSAVPFAEFVSVRTLYNVNVAKNDPAKKLPLPDSGDDPKKLYRVTEQERDCALQEYNFCLTRIAETKKLIDLRRKEAK